MWLLFPRLQSYGLDIRKIKLSCCAGTENYVILLLKFMLQVHLLIGLDPIVTCTTAELSCDAAVPACYKLVQQSLTQKYTVTKRCDLNFNFQVVLEYMKLQKDTLSTQQRIKAKRTANCSHPIKSAVTYHTRKFTIIYWYKVLFTVIN